VFDGKAPAPRAEQISQGAIRFELADGRGQGLPMPPIRVAIDATGQFQSIGIPGGRYVLRATGFPGWTLESAMLNGRDISEEPLDADASPGDITGLVVTLTDASAGVAGTVRLPSGAVAERATVLVYATDKAHWVDRGSTPRRLLRASTSTTGNFTLTGLPPGDYLVLATTDALPENWSMPEYLAPLSRIATRVSIEKRTTRTVALTSTTLPRGGAQ
jgi:hypothetical protein